MPRVASFLTLLLAMTAHPLAAQAVETGFLNRTAVVNGQAYRYQVYVPAEYATRTDWPVILFLHGSGERGADGLAQTNVGIASAIRRDAARFPAIVVMPQVPKDSAWAGDVADAAMLALRQTLTEYRTDADRVYLTGLSMGGRGAWYLAYRHPSMFAAVVPICGWITATPAFTKTIVVPAEDGPPFEALAKKLRSVPLWVLHGEADKAVPVAGSREPVAALRAIGANVQYTEFLGTEHNSWDATYASDAVISWMLQQRRKAR
jgi:predicted peptidase